MFRDAAGNLYTVGDFWNTVDFDPGPGVANLSSLGGYDIFVTKYDANGNYIWARQLGGTRYNFGYGITVDASGNVYTTGWYDGTVDFDPGAGTFNLSANNGSGYYDVFISKLDANGNFVWAKSMGGSGSDEGMGIQLDATGNIYIAGSYAYTVDFDPNAGVSNLVSPDFDAIFIAKYDANGNYIWAKSIDGTYNQEAYNIALDASGNVYTTGRLYGTPAHPVDFDPGPGVFNLAPDQNAIFVSKLDSNGNFVWAKLIEADFGQDIAFDAASNVYVTGKFVGTTDFDPNAGVFNLTSAAGPGDIFVLKLTSAGDLVWVKQMGGTGFMTFSGNENKGFGITIDPTGNVLTTGVFAGNGDFDPGAGTYTLNANSTGYPNAFISKLDKDGNFIWATALGGNNTEEYGVSITTDAAGNIYTGGKYAGTVDFDPSACVFNVVGATAGYVWKLSLGTAIPAPTITSFTPAAGPVGTTVTITGTNFGTSPTVAFYNNRAAVVTASTPTSITTTVPASAATGKISVTANCMTVQSATNFTVGVSPPPTITSFTPASGAVGTTVTITGTNFSTTPAGNVVRFNGTIATVASSTATSIVTTVPPGATTGKITVQVGTPSATSATNFTVTVAAATITINAQPASVASCNGGVISFAVSASGTTNLSYQWQKFNGSVFNNVSNTGGYSGATTATLSVNTAGDFGAGEYRCRVSGDLAADVFSATATLTLGTPSVPTITFNGPELVASSGDSYQWYHEGEPVAGATNQVFTINFIEFGVYTVAVVKNGCTSMSAPFTYLITGIETSQHDWKIYPNPFVSELNVESATPQKSDIEIVDLYGRSVKTYSERNAPLPTEDLAEGTYLLIIKTAGQHLTFRVVKTHGN
jgi:hypothetical protein